MASKEVAGVTPPTFSYYDVDVIIYVVGYSNHIPRFVPLLYGVLL